MLEDTGISPRGLLVGAAMIVGGIVFTIAVAAFVRHQLLPGGRTTGTMQVQRPVLEASPQSDRVSYEAEKRRLTDSYGWVDRDAGVARIPVDEAMRLLAEKGKAR